LLELGEAAFHEMELGIEMLVERISERAGRIVGDDGERSLGSDGLAQVAIVSLSAWIPNHFLAFRGTLSLRRR
jgi:hypothetical protein